MTTIKQRRGTAAQWTSANPVLAAGEPGFETDTGNHKIGDGAAAWNSLLPANHATYVAAFLPEKYGAVGDGTTDDTAAFQAAINAAIAAGGGVLSLAAKKYKITGQLTVGPTSGTPPVYQPSLKIVGAGSYGGNYPQYPPVGGTILDMTYAGTVGKMVTLGLGNLEITGVTFWDSGGGTLPWIYGTATRLLIHENSFYGSLVGAAANQDAIILGGTTGGDANGHFGSSFAFQGYGTVIRSNYFQRVRRAVFGRAQSNSIVVEANYIGGDCGAADGTSGAIEFNGDPGANGQSSSGSVIAGNLIEMTNYVYGVRLSNSFGTVVDSNSFWDSGGGSLACVRCDVNAKNTAVYESWNGAVTGGLTTLSEDASVLGLNTVRAASRTTQTRIPGDIFLLGSGHISADDTTRGCVVLKENGKAYSNHPIVTLESADGTVAAYWRVNGSSVTLTHSASGQDILTVDSDAARFSTSQRRPFTTKSANYTLTMADDTVWFNGTSLTATLPSASSAGAGRRFVIGNYNASALTVASAGGGIFGPGTPTSVVQNSMTEYLSDGSVWVAR